jgi:phosphate/sulfate permease
MKKYSQLQNIIATLMIFIFMIEFTGCYSTRIITSSDIKSSEICFIHGQKINCKISETIIADGILSGKLEMSEKKYGDAGETHIYLSSDSAFKINENLISLSVGSITKIEQKVPDPRKSKILITVLVVAGCALTVGLIVIIVNAAKSLGNDIGDIFNYCTTEY